MAVLGFASGLPAGDVEGNWRHLLQEDTYLEPSAASNAPHDKYAWVYGPARGGDWADGWRTIVGNKVRYCGHLRRSSTDSNIESYTITYLHYLTAGVAGKLRLLMVDDSSDPDLLFGLGLQQYVSGSWSGVSGGATATTILSHDTDYYWTVEVDKSGGTGNHAISLWIGNASAMMNSGDPYVDAAAISDALITGTPCVYNNFVAGGKGDHEQDVDVAEIFSYDDNDSPTGCLTDRVPYYGASSCPHVFSVQPKKDGDVVTGWSPTNAPANCPGDLWPTMDDHFDDDDQAGDHVSVEGDGSNIDFLCQIQQDWYEEGETPVVYGAGIGMAFYHGYSVDIPDAALMRCPTEGATIYEYALTSPSAVQTGMAQALPAHATPGGNLWTPAKLAELEIGARNRTDGATQYCNVLWAHILGTYLKQPTNNAACTAGFRPHVIQY